MSGKILDLESARRNKTERMAREPSPPAKPTALKTSGEIFISLYYEIIYMWQDNAIKNSLNKFIRSRLPPHVRGPHETDYVNDLNAQSTIETKLNMQVGIFHPGCTAANPNSWMVGFYKNKQMFTVPAEMISESYARALNIVMFVEFEKLQQK